MRLYVVCSLLALIVAAYGLADPARPKLRTDTNKSSTVQSAHNNSTTVNAAVPSPCPQNDVLSKLLLQLVLSSVATTTTQNPLVEGLNRLLGIAPSPGLGKAPTTLVTSTTVSTVTQLFSTVLSVMFKNKRIPTTIYSSSVVTVTEVQTITSTMATEPTALFRFKRDEANNLETSLESSVIIDLPPVSHQPIRPTQPLTNVNAALTNSYAAHDSTLTSEEAAYWMAVLNHPEVRQAWEQFLEVLYKVRP